MFEGLVASILNKWLGKYVEDLDTEHLNVGIFSGEVKLNNLKLKPEALFELELPIEVKYGVIGSINLTIPWSSLSSQAIVVNVEDLLIVCCPIGSEEYSAEKERKLVRAFKKKILDDLEGENFLGTGAGSLFNSLLTALTNNIQIYVRKIHVRYEDKFTKKGVACGLCVEGLSMETTNSKWKPCNQTTGSTTVYQLAKLEACSVYCNTELDSTDFLAENWREDLIEGLGYFSIRKKPFDFLIKPFNAKMKTIVSRSSEARVPKLLVDLVIHDLVCHLSRSQLHSIIGLVHLFHQLHLRREFLSFRPLIPVHGNAKTWWKYFYQAVLQQRVYPNRWENLFRHRKYYHDYKNLYKKVALNPGDTELRLDLNRAEDNLPLSSIVIAREHGKVEIKNEDPDRIEIISGEEKWWSFKHTNTIKFQVRPEKPRGIWSQLTPTEHQKLKDLGNSEVDISPEKARKYIEHKINITIHHLSGNVFVRGNEIASIALSQFLGSFETRPAAHAYKISARAESFVLEGASVEHGLVPIVNLVPGIVSGTSSSNFLYFDFEKNPLSVEADYGITFNLEQLEVVYNEHAFSEFLNFFQGIGVTQSYLKKNCLRIWNKTNEFKTMIEKRQIRIDVNMSVKAPILLIAENGILQKSVMVTVVDLGKWSLKTDLQPPLCLEDVTQMELEERLYDRLHANLDGFQILFDSGDHWQESIKLDDTENHVLSKLRGQIVLSSSIKPDYKLLPKSKLNLTLYSMKLNLSDKRIVMLLDFIESLPLPSSNTVSVSPILGCSVFVNDLIKPDVELNLQQIKNLVVSSELSRQRTPDYSDGMAPSLGSLGVDKSWSSVEISDEDVELWARTVDLPGFDDNISPSNIITSLLRVVVGEIVLVLCRSSDTVDRPYLMARISKCRLDSAFMVYGPAIQATLGGVQLIDKLHVGPSGEYLEIISTQSDLDFISILYRKVRSDCPEFRSHFHSVEQSLVCDVGVLSLTIHREAILTFIKYLQYLYQKVAHREVFSFAHDIKNLSGVFEKAESKDPPIPPGAVKFSYSFHLMEFRAKLCDTELEFLEVKVKGFESDCMFKANERMVLRAYLSCISVDDLSDITLYPKIVSIEEDKVFELKYVRHSPRLYTKGLGSGKDDVHSDGSLKLNLERIHIVFVFKMLVDLQHFIEPLIPINIIWQITSFFRKSVTSHINQLRRWNTRLHLSLCLHLPALLIPQKTVSPNLLVCNLGDLNVENFFKELTGYNSKDEAPYVIDNILLKLESAFLTRATMTITGSLKILEEVLEPVHLRFDVKRFVGGTAVMLKVGPSNKCREIPLFEVYGNLEPVKVSLGQKDLFTFLSIWKDNFGDRKFLEFSWWWKSASPIDGRTPTENEDLFVRKLQVFLSHSDACRKDTVARFTIDSVTVNLYNDIGEVLSSPVRDMNHGLCRLTLWDASVYLEKNYDSSIDMKMALQTCLLEDIRTDPYIIVKKVFQSHHRGESKFDSTISISTPPIVDATFKQTQTGERCVDILVEKTRLNLSVSFLAALLKFAFDSIPVRRNEGGFVNHGYVGDIGHQVQVSEGFKIPRLPLSVDSTSGYYSSGMSCATDDQCGLSVSLQCRKPEIVIFSSGERKTSAILFRCEFLADWSKHPGRDALVISLAGLQAWSKSHPDSSLARQKTVTVLHQCDVEIARNLTNMDDGVKVTVAVSPIDIRLSVSTVATITEIIQEMRNAVFSDENRNHSSRSHSIHDLEDLWTPKKISTYCEADVCATANEHLLPQQPSFPVGRPAESISVNIPKIQIVLEVPQGCERRPLFLVSSSFKLVAHDWSSTLNLRGEIHLQAAYHNEDIGVWEPFVEPCGNGKRFQRPWELVFQVFQGKSFPISPHINFQNEHSGNKGRKVSSHTDEPEESETSGDESEQGMTFLKRHNFDTANEIKKQNFSLSCGDSSDSENEEGALEKLTSAVGHLFTSGGSDGDLSESADTSATEDEAEEPEVETEDETASARSTTQERAVFLKKHSDSVDSGLETEAVERFAVHVLIHSKDRLELSVTPSSVKVLQELSTAFCGPSALALTHFETADSVKNSLGPGSIVTLLAKTESTPEKPVIIAQYDRGDTPPSSPGSAGSRSPTSDWDTDLDCFDKLNQQRSLTPLFEYPKESVIQLYERLTATRLLIQIPGFNDLKIVAPKISSSKLHALQPSRNQTRYHIVVTTLNKNGFQKYLVRGPLQVHNDTSYAMGLYYKKSGIEALGEKIIGEATNPFDDLIRLAVIEPDDVFDVPLFVAYHCKIYIMPAHVRYYPPMKKDKRPKFAQVNYHVQYDFNIFHSSYQVSQNGISWQEMMSDMGTTKELCCLSKQENDTTVFSVRAICEKNSQIKTSLRNLPNCTIRLLSPLVVSNLLPYAVEIKIPLIKYEVRIEAGEKTNVYFLNLQNPQKITIEVPEYLGIVWTGSFNLTLDIEEKMLTMATEQDTDGGNKQLALSIRILRTPTITIQIHSPFWLINKTGLPLQIRGSLTDVIHEWCGDGPLLFTFRKQRRRCVRVRAFNSSWSSAFSLDTPGCSGLIICKDKERKRRYRILVQCHLSQMCPKLTRIVSLIPNFIVINSCRKHLRFMEDNERADLWIDISPGQCLPFWPETDSMKMFVKFRDSKHISQHFPVTTSHTTVLRMDKGCGITVVVTGSVDQPFSIRFQNYQPGDAPVRIDNRCEDLFLKFHQKESGQVALLSPYQSLLYTWDDPSKERSLLWNVYNNKGKDFCVPFWKDGFGEERVSFHVIRQAQSLTTETMTAKLSAGLKRLTPKSPVPESNSSSSSDDSEEETERPQLAKKTRRDKIIVYWASYLEDRQRVLLLTQDERIAKRAKRALDAERSHLELFVSVAGVGVSLINNNKENIPRELGYLSLSDSAAQWEVTVAHRWKTVALELASWLEDKYKQGLTKAQIKDYIHIDFEKMQMTKPFFGELRRKHKPALWIQYRRSKHMSLFHFQIHRLQIDNQLHEAEHPTVFHPIPPPSNFSKTFPRPAIEIAYLKKYSPRCNDVFKFAKFIVQEHCLQLEKFWLSEIIQFCGSWLKKDCFSAKIRRDIALVHMPISGIPAKESRGIGSENMFEYLHCSPIKIQVTFSSKVETDPKDCYSNPFVDYFFFTLAPSFAQVKNITLKLLCFEIIGQLCNKDFVWDQGIKHFKSQFWQQIHVLIMGIKVLANPYSQFLDLSDDSHPLFYEPYLESAGVPEEFSEGISSGALGLLGHETGGPSGAATLFAALLGTALQTVVQHDDLKKRITQNEMENDFPESVIKSESNFSAVCPLALSGVVMKRNVGNGPLHGVETFFKGPGKGLMGSMTKSNCGVFNCLTMVRDGLKRAIESGEGVISRTRPPRYVNPVLGLHPYSDHEAKGLALQKIFNRGLYTNDTYWAHAALTPECKTILLITLQHIFLIGKAKYWGAYEPIWTLRVDDLMAVPTIQEDKLIFNVRQDENSSTVWNEEKSAATNDKELLQWLKNQVEAALVLSMEDKPCP